MNERRVTVSRKVTSVDDTTLTERPGLEYTISVSLPYGADKRDVSAASVELERLAPLFRDLCDGCGTAPGTVHTPDCPYADPDQIERARHEAVEEGMRP